MLSLGINDWVDTAGLCWTVKSSKYDICIILAMRWAKNLGVDGLLKAQLGI